MRMTDAIVLPSMIARKSGRIINISSDAALKPVASMVAYSMTKAAVSSLSRGMAEATKGVAGVTVNSVLVGPTWTEGVDKYVGQLAESTGKDRATVAAECEGGVCVCVCMCVCVCVCACVCVCDFPLRRYFHTDEACSSLLQRFLNVKEIGNVCVFLASPLASGINGSAQRAEGGMLRIV